MKGKIKHPEKLLALGFLLLLGCVVNQNQPGEVKERVGEESSVKTPTYSVVDLSGGPNATS